MRSLHWYYGLSVLAVAAGCSQARHDWAIPNADVTLPAINPREYPLKRAGAPPEPLPIGDSGDRLVLVHCTTSEDTYYEYRRWGRALVVVLDAPVSRGRIEITPDNGRLIENADWMPPRQPYVGLEGSINIISVSSNQILADCAFHNIIRRGDEPVYAMRGLYTFDIGKANRADLERCGIRLQAAAASRETR